jgi:hypothetical protein
LPAAQSDSEVALQQKEAAVKEENAILAEASHLAESIQTSLAIKKKLQLASKLWISRKMHLIRENKGKILTARQVRSVLDEMHDNRTLKTQIICYLLEVISNDRRKRSLLL